MISRLSAAVSLLVGSLCLSLPSFATIVQFKTSMGDFEVNLYDEVTPETVSNFLRYVEAGSYENSIIHRSVPNFVVQGGGRYYYPEPLKLPSIPTFGNVLNEPVMSNVRGSIAMAKKPGFHNSATSEWFFNLKNNRNSLDYSEGGFTVFGHVIGDGMEVVDAIAALPRYTREIPAKDSTLQDWAPGLTLDENNFVIIEAVVITNSNVKTFSLNDVNDDAINGNNGEGADTPNVNSPNSSGGGSLGFISLLALLVFKRVWRRN